MPLQASWCMCFFGSEEEAAGGYGEKRRRRRPGGGGGQPCASISAAASLEVIRAWQAACREDFPDDEAEPSVEAREPPPQQQQQAEQEQQQQQAEEEQQPVQLTLAQNQALMHVRAAARAASAGAMPRMESRLERLGLPGRETLERTLRYVRDSAPLLIHIRVPQTLELLLKDTQYRRGLSDAARAGGLPPRGKGAGATSNTNTITIAARRSRRPAAAVCCCCGFVRCGWCCCGRRRSRDVGSLLRRTELAAWN